jgi:putative hydrolase of the HAD superfamily
MIKNIIFDIGNVLLKFDYHPYIKGLLKDDDVIEHVNNAIWMTGYWNDLDKGFNTDMIFQKMLEAEPGYEEEIKLVFDNVGQCIKKEDYAIPWIKDLKKRGYRVLFLSNYAEHTMKANHKPLDFLPYMDGGVFSCNEGVVKPDRRIYQILLDRFSLVPEECVFLDDKEENIEAAKALGFHGIEVKNYKQAKEELEQLLG